MEYLFRCTIFRSTIKLRFMFFYFNTWKTVFFFFLLFVFCWKSCSNLKQNSLNSHETVIFSCFVLEGKMCFHAVSLTINFLFSHTQFFLPFLNKFPKIIIKSLISRSRKLGEINFGNRIFLLQMS